MILGLRPEDLSLDPAGAIGATVSLVELIGHEQHLALRLPEGELVWVRQGTDAPRMATGDSVRVAATGTAHIFDPVGGTRIDLESS